MDDVRIYNRALSSTEITALYDWSLEQQDITTDLTNYWRPSTELDNTDTIGTLDGTDVGTITYGADGADTGTGTNYAQLGSYTPSSVDCSGSIWAYPNVTGLGGNTYGGMLFSQRGSYAAADFNVMLTYDTYLSADNWRLGIGTLGGIEAIVGPAGVDDVWVHIGWSIDSSNAASLYINGVFYDSVALINPTNVGSQPASIANASYLPDSSTQYHGKYDDFRLYYGRVLTGPEFAAIYALGRTHS